MGARMKTVKSNPDILKLLEKLEALDYAERIAIIDRVTSNPEFVEKIEELKSEADAAVTACRDQAMNRALFMIRAKKHGAIPLDALLEISSGVELRENARGQTRSEKLRGDMEFYASYRVLLRRAKRDIRHGELVVRMLPTLTPLNETPVIQTWCNTNDTLMSHAESLPDSRWVVKLEDARKWLQELGCSVPEGLRAASDSTTPKCMPSSQSWIHRARAIWTEIEEREKGKPRPKTQPQIAKMVAKQLEDEDFKKRGGKECISDESVLRDTWRDIRKK